MKLLKKLTFVAVSSVFAFSAIAETFTFTSSDGAEISIDIKDETIAELVEQNKDKIQEAIEENNITKEQFEEAEPEIKKAVEQFSSENSNSSFSFKDVSDTVNNTMNSMADYLFDTLSAGQVGQHQYAHAYIGQLIPGPHLGIGLFNLGLTTLNVSPLLNAIDSVSELMSDAQSQTGSESSSSESITDALKETSVGALLYKYQKIPLPTITADIRLGGIILPFDVGVTATVLNTDWFGSTISDAGFNLSYWSLGGDVRYALLKDLPLGFTVSATGGFYHTTLKMNLDSETLGGIGAGLDANINTVSVGAQASAKLLIFVPYVGARALFTFGDVDWGINIDWSKMLSSSSSSTDDAQAAATQALIAAFLPSGFSNTVSYGMFERIRPQIYGGFALDMGPIDLTFGASYTFVSNVLGAQTSLRVAF